MYHLIGADGKEYGPVSLDQIRQWLGEGRLNAHTQIRRDGTEQWLALGAVPELAALLQVPPTISAPLAPSSASPRAGIQEGDYDLDIFGCFTRGWELLTSQFGVLVGGVAIYLLIMFGLSGVAQIPMIGLLFSIASLIITGPLMGGVYLLILKLVRRQPAEAGAVFSGFSDNLGQLILGHLVPALIAGATAIPGVIAMVVPIVVMAQNEAPNAGLIAIAAFGFILAIVPLLYLSTSWGFTIPLIADRRMDFWSAMKASRAQVHRNWWTVFGLFMLVGLVNFLGLLVCCVGMFITAPLAFAAWVIAYETIFTSRTDQPVASA